MHPRVAQLTVSAWLILVAEGVAAQDWLETRIAIEELVEAGRLDAAVELEPLLFERVAETYGQSSTELADAHLFMARVHARNADFVTVEGLIFDAIDIYELVRGANAVELFEPYMALGDHYLALGDNELAINAYSEARSVSRRHFGLLNLEQLEVLDRLTTVAIAMRDGDEARDLQHDKLDLVMRAYGEDSLQYLDANFAYADWLNRFPTSGRVLPQYAAIERLIKRNFDDDPRIHIRYLRYRAAGMRRFIAPQNFHLRPAFLEQALDWVEELEQSTGQPDPLLHAEVLLDLGDWYVWFRQTDEIAAAYTQAWELLGAVDDGADIREQWFGQSRLLGTMPALRSRAITNAASSRAGRIEVEFTVKPDGTTADAVLVDADPTGFLENDALAIVGFIRVRPRIVDGSVVEFTDNIIWNFNYDPDAIR